MTLEKITLLLIEIATQSPNEARDFYQRGLQMHGVEEGLASEFIDAVIVNSGLRLIHEMGIKIPTEWFKFSEDGEIIEQGESEPYDKNLPFVEALGRIAREVVTAKENLKENIKMDSLSMFPAISVPKEMTPVGRKKVSDFMVSYVKNKYKL